VPNTLVHFAVQGAASHGLWRRVDPRWIYLGCLLPDLPWILRRAVVAFVPPVDIFDLRLYTMAQASLAGTLLLCAALALLTRAPRLVLAVLGANALLHLLLDATEVKWGNGVHLLAPFSWRMTSFDLLAGESPLYLVLAVAGAALLAWEIARRPRATLALDLGPARLAAAGALLVAYFVAPLPFLGAIEASDSYSADPARGRAASRSVGLDRTAPSRRRRGRIRLWTASWCAPGRSRARRHGVALRRVLAPDVLRVDRLVEHRQDRDWPSYLALVLLGLVWARPLLEAGRARPSSSG
jgi:hypothetical protein